MLDVMDVMAKWKVVGVWKIIIFNLYVQIHKYNLFKYTNTLKYAPKYSLNFGEKWKNQNFWKSLSNWFSRERVSLYFSLDLINFLLSFYVFLLSLLSFIVF